MKAAATRKWIFAVAAALAWLPVRLDAAAQRKEPSSKPTPRARAISRSLAPAPIWRRQELDAFFPDARAHLGPAPSEPAAPLQPAEPPPMPGARAAPAAAQAAAGTPAFSWSSVVEAAVLEDEVKAYARLLAAPLKNAVAFNRQHDEVRRHYAYLATLFSVIAQFDGEIRWKDTAASLSAALARTATNCKAASDGALRDAKSRLHELQDLIGGGAVDVPPAEADEMGTLDRPSLMTRLETSIDGRLDAWTAREADFNRQRDTLRHEAQIVSLLARIITDAELDFADDETYQKHAAQLQAQARELVEAARQGDFPKAQSATNGVRQACDACHADFRG